MKKNRLITLLGLVLVLGILCASCGSSSYDYAVKEMEAVAPGEMSMEDSYAYNNKSLESGDYYRDANEVKERMLVYDVDYSLETKEFDAACASLESKATELGGFVSSYDSYTGGYNTNVTYSFRIPSKSLTEFTALVETLGTVTRKNTNVTDYTDTYYDYQTEIDLLKTEEEYVQKYLDMATEDYDRSSLIDQLLSIRREIARLERASKNVIETVTYSTVDIQIRAVTVYTDIKVTYGDTLLSAFREGWEGFADFCRELLYNIVLISPVIVLLAIVFFAIFIPVKVNKKKKAQKRAAAIEQAKKQAGFQNNTKEE